MTKQVELEFREGGSDKVYRAELKPEGAGYVVRVAWGRRNQTPQTGTKTPTPVPLDQAEKIFDKIVAEKTGKGYRPIGGSTIPQMQEAVRLSEAIPMMLLEPIEEHRVEHFLRDSAWTLEPKYDGKHVLLHCTSDGVTAQNRSQKECPVPRRVVEGLRGLEGWVLDGELVEDQVYLFDAVHGAGRYLIGTPYAERRRVMESLKGRDGVVLGEYQVTEGEKRALYARLVQDQWEGAVFKRLTGLYKAGKFEDTAVKFKFWADCSPLVIARNDTGDHAPTSAVNRVKLRSGKRSVQVALSGPKGEVVNVGDVSVPANYPMPALGTLVNVRYLYAFAESQRLFQPQYEGERDDLVVPDALGVLKYKKETEE